MLNFLISLGLGIIAALIDVLPMIVRKLDKSFILSAFFMWIALGIIIPVTKLIPLGWLNGICVALLCVLPITCLVTKLDKQAIPVMLITTTILGAAIGYISKMLIK
jgi:hypothetical protein